MSYKARRVVETNARPFPWSAIGADGHVPGVAPVATSDVARTEAKLARLEREAFAKGYEQGERAGIEAGTKRVDAMLRRLGQTIEELASLRRTILAQTERQMVDLALAIAKRIVRREVTIDQDIVVALARVAIDRLGEMSGATIHLNPEDAAFAVGRHGEHWAGAGVSVVADQAVARGGCRVESEFGLVEASVDSQVEELSRAVLLDKEQQVMVAANDR